MLGTWNVRRLYRAGALTETAREVSQVQIRRSGLGGTKGAQYEQGTVIFIWKRK